MTRRRAQRVYDLTDLARQQAKMHESSRAIIALVAGTHPERNPLRQNTLLKQHGKIVVDALIGQTGIIRELTSMLYQETPNANLPWTDEEDAMLVSDRAAGDPIHVTANNLGRTPSACATRLSVLVGIPRDDLVEAYIDGTLNETPVTGVFQGHVRKVAAR